jgi:putative ABC transport system substrate-binding protein
VNRAIVSLVSAFLLGIQVADAQPAKPLPRVAYVWIFGVGPSAPFGESFAGRLAELGWVDGKTVRIEYRDAKGDPKLLDAMMQELVDSKVDVIAVACTPEAVVAKKKTSTIPVVVAATGDPVRSGLVASMARRGGNITGVSAALNELSAKRMEILPEVAPGLTRAAAVWNPVRGDNAFEVAAMQEAARKLGMQLNSQQFRDREELEVALDTLAKERIQGITEAGDPLVFTYAPELVAFAERNRMLAIYDNRY